MADRGIDIASRLDEIHLEAYQGMEVREFDVDDVVGSVESLRASAALRERQPLPDGVTTEDHYAPGPDGAPDVMVRLYRPDGLAPGGPAFYWIHGGGMVLGNVDNSDGFCGEQAANLGILVASVEYRLAPEHPYPAPMEDCYAGLRWFASSAEELGIDPARIAIGGGSAGGGLAAGLALLVRDRGEIDICFQLLVYPMIDDRNISNSSHPSPTCGSGIARRTSSVGAPTSRATTAATTSRPTPPRRGRPTSRGCRPPTSTSARSTSSSTRTSTTPRRCRRRAWTPSCTSIRSPSTDRRTASLTRRSRSAGPRTRRTPCGAPC